MDDITFDFEQSLAQDGMQGGMGGGGGGGGLGPGRGVPTEDSGPKPRNYRQTVCTYWLRGLCMKGDTCGFLHQFDPERMPVCRSLLKFGVCKEPDCPYKHTMDAIKECNMYKLGFCIYGPACRFKHTRQKGPPPDPESLEACKPREHRNLNIVANQANENIMPEREMRGARRPRGDYLALPGGGGGGPAQGGALQQYGGGGGGGTGGNTQPLGQGGRGQYPGQPPAGQAADPALLASVGQGDMRYGW